MPTPTWSVLGSTAEPLSARQRAAHVIVVGAGMSGLVTARILHDSGLRVTVLEARNRTGGRIWTNHTLGVPIDLGASWVHGADSNPLSRWCWAAGVALQIHPTGERRFYEQGSYERFKPLSLRAWRTLSQAGVRAAILMAQGRRSGRTPSLAQAFEPLLANTQLPLADRRLLAWIVSMSESVEGAPADQIALDAWYPAEANGVNAMPVGGYARLIADAAHGLDVQLNRPVTCVRLSPTGAIVETGAAADGSRPAEQLAADAVVISVPLGVLKSGLLRFEPDLPAPKRAAIARIGFGASAAGDAVMNKLVLTFAERFWDDTSERCNSLPATPADRGAYTNWINVEPLAGVPALMGFANGRAAVHSDRVASDDEIVARGLASLQRMTGRTPPPPTGVLITRWLSDPWAQGSYSFNSIHSCPEDRSEYSRPVADRIWFAGEGTQARDYGTVQAALRSGQAAAESIYRHLSGRTPSLEMLPWGG